MEKLENVADQTHLIHSHRKSISSDGTLHEEDEFCYEEDDFEEDHPFISTRMTASCEGVYSIIGNNNGYHLHNSGQSSSQRDIGELRAYAASMPHIGSTSSLQGTMDFENELNIKHEPQNENLEGKAKRTKDETAPCTSSSQIQETNGMSGKESHEPCQNALEEEGEEEETLDLEFEYEPGISLSHMEFGRQSKPFQQFSKEVLKEEKLDSGKLFRRKMSEMCTSSSSSISQRDRYQNMMTMTSSQTSDCLSTSTSESREGLDRSASGGNFSNKPQMMSPSRCTFCGVDYESGK